MNKIINTPEEAVLRLKQGNIEYMASKKNNSDISAELREETAKNGQKPYAIIMTCSDSRVPPEHIFSAGIGELFVVRTAGNVVNDMELGSIEIGVQIIGAKAIVVMGHTGCGAVAVAVKASEKPEIVEGHTAALINEIQSGIAGTVDVVEAENLNIANSYKKVLKSPVLAKLIEQKKILIHQAKYDLHTGEVVFFD